VQVQRCVHTCQALRMRDPGHEEDLKADRQVSFKTERRPATRLTDSLALPGSGHGQQRTTHKEADQRHTRVELKRQVIRPGVGR
jgi:hypothetical protein